MELFRGHPENDTQRVSPWRPAGASGPPGGAVEVGPVHEQNSPVVGGPLQLQHGDDVGPGGAQYGPRNVQCLLWAPGRPVPAQIHSIDPHLALQHTTARSFSRHHNAQTIFPFRTLEVKSPI